MNVALEIHWKNIFVHSIDYTGQVRIIGQRPSQQTSVQQDRSAENEGNSIRASAHLLSSGSPLRSGVSALLDAELTSALACE